MKFTKMQGIGNDYVYVDCTKKELDNPAKISEFVSDRHFGIGSDGLILIKSSDKADFFMEMYNADGSQAEMCGNGIRCVGKFVYDKGLTDKTSITVDTLVGIKYLDLNVVDGKVSSVRVNMGQPILKPELIPVVAQDDCDEFVDESVEVDGETYKVTCVSMGNPHAIVYVDDTDSLPIEVIGPKFENHKIFPRRTNTEFIQIIDRSHLKMRVWERGSGETLACGTGACASLVATVLNGLCDTKATLMLLGGDLEIEWDRENNVVYMEGPATTVFEGEVEIPF
ncbi:diaminopimelate epimerase [Falcatimonas sp. MSJ-15]|uniref:diaminopimelate epimerase n=1 Tax=Falcatimonas sp. MSJ-15 TaxID=2841515 RepID=UPI001C128608|nr:diaminopimelate epimerase [Falcatimonas sp. MSJ-15]MBU5469073.1 diaminopimelate epimerase [Falcatimonas sp. MSJ-15]